MLCFVFVFLGFVLSTHAQALQWKQKTVELTASAKEEKIETAFVFRNTGGNRVTIQAVKPDCDCTLAELAKKTFEPGETGELKVLFKLEGRVGLQEKLIAVITDDAPDAPTVLTLRVNIPELVEIGPRLLVWSVGEPLAEKSVNILLATAPTLAISEIKASEPGIETRLETVRPNRQYRLFLKPTSSAKPLRSTIFVTTKSVGSDEVSSFTIYARVE